MARVWLLVILVLGLCPAAGVAACRQALAIGLDISGSVDGQEYRLQLDGLAGALVQPDVRDAFLAMPGAHVRLLIYEWGGLNSQRVLVGWTDVRQAQDLQMIAGVLLATTRQPFEPSTALGTAMLYGGSALAAQTDCWRRTMDLSGDGQSNQGPRPGDVSGAAVLFDVTINALVIGADAPPFSDSSVSEVKVLTSYFQAEVIAGPDAFVQAAVEFADFQDAMAKKLLRELRTRAVGALAGGGR